MLDSAFSELPGLSLLRLSSPFSSVSVWSIDFLDSNCKYNQCCHILSAFEKQRAERFNLSDDCLRYAVTRAALRLLLARHLEVRAQELDINLTASGKPFLEGARNLRFNISHSGRFSLIGISRSHEVGIDIEERRDSVNIHELAAEFLTERESQFVAQLPEFLQDEVRFRIWTCKEAVLKAYGHGISANLRQFSVLPQSHRYIVAPELGCTLSALYEMKISPISVAVGYEATIALI